MDKPLTIPERFELIVAILLIGSIAVAVTLGIRAMASSDAAEPAPHPTVTVTASPEVKVVYTLPECEEEDSRNCIWHADQSGNGEGVSFVDIDGVAYYPEP